MQRERVANLLKELRRTGVRSAVRRFVGGARRYGLVDTVRRALGSGDPYWWHRLDLPEGRIDVALPDGLSLARAGTRDLERYAQVAPPMDVRAAPKWLEDGNALWLVSDGDRVAFACWIFPARMPMGKAPGGWLQAPDGVVFLEASVTAPDYRGRGVAPGAWSALALALSDAGVRTMFTKVTEENIVTQRSLTKAGFSRADDDDPLAAEILRQLRR